MVSIAIASGLVILFLLCFWSLFEFLPKRRMAHFRCPCCRIPFGRPAFFARIPFNERLYGPGVKVNDGPRRYLGASVVKCRQCEGEFVFSELGGLVEPFVAKSSTSYSNPLE
jgi:hypothetical protein